MRRREFITLAGSGAVWPLVALAQQKPRPVIGFISSGAPDPSGDRVRAFKQGLRENGFVEGQNVDIQYRWAGAENKPLDVLAANLVGHPVDVIMAGGEPSALSSKSVTSTIPIVFTGGSDPVPLGLVSSLSRPGANVTGATVLNVELAPKRLQVLKELFPTAPRVAGLLDPTAPGFEYQSKELPEVARTLGIKIEFSYARSAAEIEIAFEDIAQNKPAGLMVGASPFFNSRSAQLAALSARHALPVVFQTREFAARGGLLSYGGSLVEAYRIAGVYTGRILKGEKPKDLPVQQVTKVELFINLKTANALGLTIPLPLLARADEVIE